MNKPSNHSTREYLGEDIFEETQRVTDVRDDYEDFQKDLRPKTYREKYKSIYVFTNLFKLVFPYLSGGTLLGLVIFLAFDIETLLQKGISLTGWIVGIISLLGCVFLVGINETVKTRSLSEAFYNIVKKISNSWGVKARAIITTILSIVGSAIGLYLITYQISDQSGEIKTRSENIQGTAAKTWSDDSLRIVQGYEATISQKRETMQSFDPNKFRTRRDQINNEIIALTQEREDRIKTAKSDRDNATNGAILQMESELTINDENATGRGYIAFAVIVFLELLNIYCHFFTWQYKAKAVKEGIKFGVIINHTDDAHLSIQLQQMGVPSAGGNHTPGVNNPSGLSGIDVNGPRKIGFTQSHEEQKPVNPKPINDSDPGLIKKILEELNDLKGQLSQGFLSSTGAQTTSTETIKKEVVLDRSHPKFTRKVQPDEYRGIDRAKYKIFTNEAKKVLAIEGRYNKTLIAQRTGLARNSVSLYLKVAFERNDLQP